jgi:IMP dehydrogenase
MIKELTYDDISLFTRQISTIKSRFTDEITTNRSIIFGKRYIDVGVLMSAPMFDVTGFDMQVKLLELGQLPIIHRFMGSDEQISILDRVLSKTNYNTGYIYSYSIGINDYKDKLEKFENFLSTINCGELNFLICIDTANGANTLLEEPIKEINRIKESFKDCCNIEILTGNVVTKEACSYLYLQGVKFIRCGISAGSVCSTSVVTAVYRPPVSMLIEICSWRDEHANDLYIIADGGIRGTDDILKAIACGADFVMSGRLFAGYDESNGQFVTENNFIEIPASIFTKSEIINGQKINRNKKYYRGMASEEMALLNNRVNNLNKDIIPEGVSDYVEYKADLTKDVQLLLNSIRSSMSYMNAYDLFKYKENCEIVEITDNSNRLRKPLNTK